MAHTATRKVDLRYMLSEQRRELLGEIAGRIRDGRTNRPDSEGDELERSDADTQGDIEMALVQLKADTLARIDQALARLDAGQYGWCVECEHDIAERRLRALPFAVRCQACEQRREQAAAGGARHIIDRRPGFLQDVTAP